MPLAAVLVSNKLHLQPLLKHYFANSTHYHISNKTP